MNQRGKIKSFGVLKTATIGGIVTAALIVVPLALFLVVFMFVRLSHHLTGNTVATPYTVGQASASATPGTSVEPTKKPEKRTAQPLRLRDVPIILAIASLFYGIFGFLLFGLWSWLYNLLSPRFGGIEIEWTDGPEEKPPLS